MKKILITTLSFSLLALSAKAASISWSTGLIKAPSSAESTSIGTTVFGNVANSSWVATLKIYADASCSELVMSDSVKLIVGSDNSRTYDKTSASYSMLAGLSNKGDFDKLNYSTTYYYKILLEGTTVDYKASITSANAGNFTTGANASASTSVSGSKISGWTTQSYDSVTPIPEPTSALLFLLGVAGLGLRRKVS